MTEQERMSNAGAVVDESVIPKSWFRAQTFNVTMGDVVRGMDRRAPVTGDERVLGRFVLPPFQRPPVWSREQQVRFIESCWMGLPIGVYVVNMGEFDSPFDLWLLDGQQRVTAIVDYMADGFPVFGHFYSQLPDRDHRAWEIGRVFPRMEVRLECEAELREVYDRLAYGGTPHAPKPTK